MVRRFDRESLSHDPIHGYIPFVANTDLEDADPDEVFEQDIIDHPWVQRLRQIHQLQTAMWVYPTAEHTRFQHVLGVMHVGSLAISHWFDSLAEVCPGLPSRHYVESLVRMAALLHDIGHGPFSHFFDDRVLSRYGVTHEDLGGQIICGELAELLTRVRRTPSGELRGDERLDPAQIAFLIKRPKVETEDNHPDWLIKLRALFSGVYTIDNMDFVLRDAYTSGFNQRAFDLERLLHYSFFSEAGLTIHPRGLPALIGFIETRANLFRAIYFHRTVRAIDLCMGEIFAETMRRLLPCDPTECLDDYRLLTEFSLITDVQRWSRSDDPELHALGDRWGKLLCRNLEWRMAAERTVNFHGGLSERSTIYSEPDLIERRLREKLPPDLESIELRLDVARHYHRPAAAHRRRRQNYLLDPVAGTTRELDDEKTFRSLPTSFTVLRVFTRTADHDRALNLALDAVLGDVGDASTNM